MFWQSNLVQADPVNLLELTLPNYTTGKYDRNHLSFEGKILQNISLENVMVRLGDRGKVWVWDLRILHSLLYEEAKLSWRHIIMMNIWYTRNQFKRKLIPYVRLINALIIQQNRLAENSLWVVKPLDDFDFPKMRKGLHIFVEAVGERHKVVDRDTGFRYEYPEERGDEEMEEGNEEEEEEKAGHRPLRQRFSWRHNAASNKVAQFMVNSRRAAYGGYNLGQQDIYDNVSTREGGKKA
ncbi:hypothetical protein Hanom_Chr03g00205101 [Helianthus anomalus]